MKHNFRLGKMGEGLARHWLQRMGYSVLENNWRTGRYEIDIIAAKENKLHCLEVKTRTGSDFGWPEESVTKTKCKQMKAAAEILLDAHDEFDEVQLHILAITLIKGKVEYHFIEMQWR